MKPLYILPFILFPLLPSFAQNSISIKKIADNLNSPTTMAHAGDGSGRIFICEQYGVIMLVKNGQEQAVPFLDIRDRIIKQQNAYSERGLLGLAFHPDYKTNGKFYIYYSASTSRKENDHKSVIAEYHVSANHDLADKNSGHVILEIEEPESNHNGGQLAFGPDGYLYVGVGDGGGAGDEHGKIGNGQNIETLLGKVLRIDVNGKSSKRGYRIPHDNPFVNKPGRDEIWAYGFRNPWRFSFDRKSGMLFCGDVGQDKYEEVNIVKKGKNYGWRIMEGNHCFYKECQKNGLELPIIEYSHTEGISITGGYVYRGSDKSWAGRYLFADWSGKIFMLTMQTDGTWKRDELNWAKPEGKIYINSMGEDEEGELYLLTMKGIGSEQSTGVVYKIILSTGL